MKRGIIANSGKMIRQGPDTVSISGNISKQDLNYYLLYWDKILMPTNNIINVSLENEDELLKTGFFERPKVKFKQWTTNIGKGSYNPFVIAQSIIANKVIENDIEFEWTVHQIGEKVAIGNEQSKDYKSIKVDLVNCLPVPSSDIDIYEILDFKEKRADELEALHNTIDELYLDILQSPDQDLKKKKSISEFRKSIEDINKVSKENFNLLTKYDFTTELNIDGKDIAVALGGGAAFDFFATGMTLPLGTIVSGIASTIKINASRTKSVEKASNNLKLNYLADANKEKIIK